MKTKAILDSGAGIAIVTKQMCKKWGKPTIRETRMKLQLADGYVERHPRIARKDSCAIMWN